MPEQLPIHVIIAAYNEAPIIAEVLAEIKATVDCPVIVVDDGSTDQTAQLAKTAGAIVIQHPVNRGAGAACMTGITLARQQNWSCAVFMDADGQHLPKDILTIYQTYQETSADLVIGSRFSKTKNDIPWLRRRFNGLANRLTNLFCRGSYSDTQSGFRLLGRRAIKGIDLVQDDFSYCSEMIIQADREQLKIAECPIHVQYTEYSVSKGQDFQVGLTTAFQFLWKIMFR
ncbi:MAG: glycosyltransferase family 2 protein [Bacteroidota bacterium]